MRIAVFGGSFDPPHLGHQQIILTVLERGLVDQVWLLPVKYHPFAKHVTSAEHRLAMVEILVKKMGDDRVQIESYELDQQEVSYTFQTLQTLRKAHPEHEFFWLMGSDQLPSFDKWFSAAELVERFPILVYPRQGYGWEKLAPGVTALKDFPVIDISSTQARAALKADQSTAKLVLPEVAEYSTTHHLYES